MVTAQDIMTRDVITVKKDLPISELSEIFIEKKINGIPVVDDDGAVIGMVTESDLIEQNKNLHIPTVISLFDAVIYLESHKKFEEELKKLTGSKVEDIYTKEVITVPPDKPIIDIASIMAEQDIHTIPVVEHGKLLGIIGKVDILKGMAQD